MIKIIGLLVILTGCNEQQANQPVQQSAETTQVQAVDQPVVKSGQPEVQAKTEAKPPKAFLGIVEGELDLGECGKPEKGNTLYVIEDGLFRYCNGSQWATMDLKGQKGEKGDAGLDGLGLKGDKGEKGDKGDTGQAGLSIKGDKGDTGATGLAGASGNAGATGAKGDKGDKGDTGDTGLTGSQGVQGLQGTAGTTGTNGTNGEDGANIASVNRAATGAECATGGKALDTWTDENDNGTYESGVDAGFKTVYACNGSDGSSPSTTITEYTISTVSEQDCVELGTTPEGWTIFATMDGTQNNGIMLNIIDKAYWVSGGYTYLSACHFNASWAWMRSHYVLVNSYQWLTLTPTMKVYWKPFDVDHVKIRTYTN